MSRHTPSDPEFVCQVARNWQDIAPFYGRPHAESVQHTLDYWAGRNAERDAAWSAMIERRTEARRANKADGARDAAMLRILRSDVGPCL